MTTAKPRRRVDRLTAALAWALADLLAREERRRRQTETPGG